MSRGVHAPPESVVLWDLRGPLAGGRTHARCVMEQCGEDFFELTVRCGDEWIAREPFREVARLLARAEELRAELKQRGGGA